MRFDSVTGTIAVAVALCFACSLVVSAAYVGLKPLQEANKALNLKTNILDAAGMLSQEGSKKKISDAKTISELYDTKVAEYVIDLDSGDIAPNSKELAEENWDPREALNKKDEAIEIPPSEDVAVIKKRTKLNYVYVVKSDDGKVSSIILPVKGKGLWSIMYGFLALEPDTKTVKGITFYEHGETPGLGAEIENPSWRKTWIEKEVLDEEGDVELNVVKGGVSDNPDVAKHQIDSLSGATITSRGVELMIRYWLGENGYGQFLEKVRDGSIQL